MMFNPLLRLTSTHLMNSKQFSVIKLNTGVKL